MLAVPGDLPHGAGWAYEIKWDGVRVLTEISGGRLRAYGRSGRDMTATYPELAAVAGALGPTEAVLDGEIVAFGAGGVPDFALLAHRIHLTDPHRVRRAAAAVPVRYLVFDLLVLAGRELLDQPYDARRARLAALPGIEVPDSFPGGPPGAGEAVLGASAAAGLEGVVAKRRASPYRPGRRSPDWVKVKNVRRQSVVIGGWEPGAGRRADRVGALLVGVSTPAGPRYAGQVGTGFSEATLARLAELLAPLRTDRPPFPDVGRDQARTAVWVEPMLVAEVEYTAWTPDGRLRHPSFKGLRDDVDPLDAVREDTGRPTREG
ncbi:bifunctional non-homologous end joining protein LigD [Frankia sp. EI5c]|nr:bifunctional non-homologous end joining protein LigD [Frankia sp. EI5c]